jgi:hypothetical protein
LIDDYRDVAAKLAVSFCSLSLSSIKKCVNQGTQEQLDPDDFLLESSPSVGGNHSLSPTSECSEGEDMTPEEIIDDIDNASDFRESKVLMINVPLCDLELEFDQKS